MLFSLGESQGEDGSKKASAITMRLGWLARAAFVFFSLFTRPVKVNLFTLLGRPVDCAPKICQSNACCRVGAHAVAGV